MTRLAVVRPDLFKQPSEQALYEALIQLVPQTEGARSQRNYQQLVEALAQVAPTVSNFFDGAQSVMVMDADLEVRRNRLNLLGLLRNHARVLADFGAIVKPSHRKRAWHCQALNHFSTATQRYD